MPSHPFLLVSLQVTQQVAHAGSKPAQWSQVTASIKQHTLTFRG